MGFNHWRTVEGINIYLCDNCIKPPLGYSEDDLVRIGIYAGFIEAKTRIANAVGPIMPSFMTPPKNEDVESDLYLVATGPNVINCIKEIRACTKYDLVEAKFLVDQLHDTGIKQRIKTKIPQSECIQLKKKFADAGCTVSII